MTVYTACMDFDSNDVQMLKRLCVELQKYAINIYSGCEV